MPPFTLEEIKKQASKPISQVQDEKGISFRATETQNNNLQNSAGSVDTGVVPIQTQTIVQPAVLSPDIAKKDYVQESNRLDKIVKENQPTPNNQEQDITPAEREILDIQKTADVETKAIEDAYKLYSGQVDSRTEQAINQIKEIKKSQISEAKEANARVSEAYARIGLREGMSRYATQSTASVMSKVEIDNFARVNDLLVKEADLITEAQNARDEKQYSLFQEKMKELRTTRKEKNDALKDLRKTASDERKKAQEGLARATRDAAILGVYAQGVKDPAQIFDMVNFTDQGSMVGDITIEEIKKTLDSLKPAGEKLTGDYGEYMTLKEAGEFKGGFFDYVKAKKDAGRDSSGGEYQAEESGNVQRDADSIMAGVLNPTQLSTKGNYAASVMSEVAKRKEQARVTGDIVGIMKASAGGKDPEASFATSFEKAVNVVGQIADLQKLFESDDKPKVTGADGKKVKLDMSPITGIFKSANPYDTKAQSIKAQLSAIVPNLARGIYGEVGVLTDNDVQIYSRTLPNLRSTEEVRKAVLGLTIRSIQRAIENKIRINAGTNRDLSNPALIQTYLEVKGQADKLLAPYEAMIAKEELSKMTLPATGTSTTSGADFWGKAN